MVKHTVGCRYFLYYVGIIQTVVQITFKLVGNISLQISILVLFRIFTDSLKAVRDSLT